MKRVTKSHPPSEFQDWLRDNANLDCSYAALQGKEAHRALKRHLLKEQGYLCPYTGRAISNQTSHVEHIKPQSRCTNGEDVEYRNMLACFPADGGDTSYGYGAPVKGSRWNQGKFINPCQQDCERRFVFTWNGKIKPTAEGDSSAHYTISTIRLDHSALQSMRHSAIKGFFGFGRRVKPLSIEKAKLLLPKIDKLAASSGELRPFCFVLKQLLPKYIRGL